MVVPFLWMLLTSLMTTAQAFAVPPSFIPNPFMWSNYPQSFNALPFNLAYMNSAIVAVSVTVVQLITCAMAAYAFARIQFPGREIIFFVFLATMMIPFQLTIIPIFLTMKQFGLLDTLLSLILPPALERSACRRSWRASRRAASTPASRGHGTWRAPWRCRPARPLP